MNSNSVRILVKEKENKEREYVVSKKDAELSELLTGTINDYPDDPFVQLTDVEEKTIERVIDYLRHFKGVPPPEIPKPIPQGDKDDEAFKKCMDEWSFNFIDKIGLDDLVNVTVTANFMGIQSLLDLCCAKFANLCKDKTEEDIFKVFNITETFTEEEKEKLRQENSWIEENI